MPKALIYLLVFIAGFSFHFFFQHSSSESRIVQVRENSPEYHYINPLLYVDNSQSHFDELNSLRDEVEEYLNKEIIENKIDRASFYYRDMNTGAWTGVRPDDKFVPGSMLKVAVLMTYLRLAEDNPDIMNQSMYYKKNLNEKQNYPPQIELVDGYYPVSRLLGQAIIESDNVAAATLSLPREKEISELYIALRFPPIPETHKDFLSTRDISTIFRSLYSSTYLLNSYSEQALELLTQTKFDKGITQGVDPSIQVAHKFGEHTVYYEDKTIPTDFELHDCGIVYYPRKPYFVCVMTKGKSLANLEKVIGDVSKITQTFVK